MTHRAITPEKAFERLKEIAHGACSDWQSCVEAGDDSNLKLYWIGPTKERRFGRLKVASKSPKRGWKLMTGMVMSQGWTYEDAYCYVLDWMMRVPIMRGPVKADV